MKQFDDAQKALKRWGDQAQQGFTETKDKVEDLKVKVEDIKTQAVDKKDKVVTFTKDNPEKSLLAALGIGALVGLILGLMMRRRR